MTLDLAVPTSALSCDQSIPTGPKAERREKPDDRMRPIFLGRIVIEILSDPRPNKQGTQSETNRPTRYLPVSCGIHRKSLRWHACEDQREYDEHYHYFFHLSLFLDFLFATKLF